MRNWAAVGLAVPACVLAAASTVALLLGAFGRYPMWPYQPMNESEAAATRDEAELLRLIEYGNDPNARYDVRPGLLFDFPAHLTPLEAAVAAGDALMVTHLATHGVVIDAPLWNRMRCLAENDEVSAALDRYRPAGAALRCNDVEPPWRIDGNE